MSWIWPSSRTSSSDQVVEQVEDGRRQHVHAEEAEVMARAQAGDLEPQLGQRRVRLLDDLVDRVDVGPLGEPPAGERAVLVDQVLAGRLDGRDGAVLGGGQVDHLPGAPPGLGGEIEVIAQQQQERIAGHELAGAPDRVAVALGLGLDREPQALLQVDEPPGLLLGPVDALEGRPQVRGIVAEMIAIDGLVARRADDADLLDPALERLLGDDLEHGLGQAVAVDERQHRLLHRVGRRILPRPPARRRDDRLGDLHVASPLLLIRDADARARRAGLRRPGFRHYGSGHASLIPRPAASNPRVLTSPGPRARVDFRTHHAGLGM